MIASASHSRRVLALVTDGLGGHGGIAEYNRQLLSALAECNFDRGSGGASPGKATVIACDAARRGRTSCRTEQVRLFSFALRMAMTLNVDVVFCGHLLMAPLAAAIAKLVGAPLWIQVHGIEAWKELSSLHRRSIQAAALVTSVSRYTRRRLLQWVTIDPVRVKILPNTVDSRFRAGPKPAALIDRYDLHGKAVLLTVSRLASSEGYKGHDRVIRALPQVLLQHPHAVYLIVGDGDDRPRLESIAVQMGVAESVHFAGLVSQEILPDYYRLADVFVMPSTGEGFGIAFLEAMTSGIPVIGGNRDGSLDPLADGALGTIVDPEDEAELASAICAALVAGAASVEGCNRFDVRAFRGHLQAILSGSLGYPDSSSRGPRSNQEIASFRDPDHIVQPSTGP